MCLALVDADVVRTAAGGLLSDDSALIECSRRIESDGKQRIAD